MNRGFGSGLPVKGTQLCKRSSQVSHCPHYKSLNHRKIEVTKRNDTVSLLQWNPLFSEVSSPCTDQHLNMAVLPPATLGHKGDSSVTRNQCRTRSNNPSISGSATWRPAAGAGRD